MVELTHFEVREEALMLKKVAATWLAMHLPATNTKMKFFT